jgi:hypothetical protein
MAAKTGDAALAEFVSQFYADPYRFVCACYPWQTGILTGFDGPDKWQREILEQIGAEVAQRRFDGRNAVPPLRFSTASGHGIGKSALTAWLVDWIMSTRPHAQGTVTANTFTQLETKTWAAIAKWTKLCITGNWFRLTGNKLYKVGHEKTWFCSAQTCKEENSEAFAGQHAAGSTSFYLFDESSAVPDKIFEVAEGGLTDGEPMIFLFGNPTRSTGKFYRATFGGERNRWNTRSIDSRESAFTNKQSIQEWVDDYGEDSDFVRVRVRGLPPKASDAQFIASDTVFEAQRRLAPALHDDPLIVGVDLARGGDDNTVFWFRRGSDAKSIPPVVLSGEETRDSMFVITKLVDVLGSEYDGVRPAVAFLDGTGGMGAIVDRCKQMGYPNVVEINFGWKASDPGYANQRSFMWGQMRDWLKYGSIPTDERLEMDLTAPGYRHNQNQQLVLEKKEDIKKRLGASPDFGDSLALTFAQKIGPAKKPKPHSANAIWATRGSSVYHGGWML